MTWFVGASCNSRVFVNQATQDGFRRIRSLSRSVAGDAMSLVLAVGDALGYAFLVRSGRVVVIWYSARTARRLFPARLRCQVGSVASVTGKTSAQRLRAISRASADHGAAFIDRQRIRPPVACQLRL